MWILSPSARGRVGELRRMLASVEAKPDRTVIVTTQPDPIQPEDVEGHVLTFAKSGMLFGEWFNLGLDYISSQESGAYEVLCIGSSLIASPRLAPDLTKAIREGHGMAGPDFHRQLASGQIRTLPPQRTVYDRIEGMCFMIRGELGLRFDPQFRWWYADDDLEMQARQLGPVALVGTEITYPAQHQLSEVQALHAAEDREKFVAKHGKEPW